MSKKIINLVQILSAPTQPDWWQVIKQDAQTKTPCFITIRPNSDCIQVYYCGARVASITCDSNPSKCDSDELVATINKKYIVPMASMERDNIRLTGNMAATEAMRKSWEGWRLADRFNEIKAAGKLHAGPEKVAIQTLLQENPNIINLEFAMRESRNNENEKDPMDTRIDSAAVRETAEGRVAVVHYEVKLLTDLRLRSRNGQEPEVMEQLRKYAQSIRDRQNDVKQRYQAIAEAVNNLGIQTCYQRPTRAKFNLEHYWERLAKGEFDASPEVRLVLIGWSRNPEPAAHDVVDRAKKAGFPILKFKESGTEGIAN